LGERSSTATIFFQTVIEFVPVKIQLLKEKDSFKKYNELKYYLVFRAIFMTFWILLQLLNESGRCMTHFKLICIAL